MKQRQKKNQKGVSLYYIHSVYIDCPALYWTVLYSIPQFSNYYVSLNVMYRLVATLE